MADREPRRRKKRKDSTKKDDHHSDDSSTMAFHKLDHKDLDQDADEEIIIPPSHQPSKLAQVVFMILFLALAAIMSSVFIALHGSSSQLEMFNGEDHHTEKLHEEPHLPDTEAEHGDTHEEEELIDLFPDLMKQFQAVVGGDQAEENVSGKEKENIISDKITVSDFVENPSIITNKDDIDVIPDIVSTSETIEQTSNIDNKINNIEVVTESTSIPVKDDVSSSTENVREEIIPTPREEMIEHIEETVLMPPEILDKNPVKEEVISEKPKEKSESEVKNNNINKENVAAQEVPAKSKPDIPSDVPNISSVESKAAETDAGKESLKLPDDRMDLLEEYEHADLTNKEDYNIKDQLDEIEKIIEKSPNIALKKYEAILKVNASSPRALYGKARALDRQADVQRSNKILEDAITAYQKVMHCSDVPEKLYTLAGNRCAERMQFRGFIGKSLKLLLEMSSKFPKNIEIKNKIAVGYLLIGRNKEAKQAFTEALKEAPNNGFAKVHLGFILKTDESDYENAIQLMTDGINSREPGVIDGRFYLHLGDALARTGRATEAMQIYEDGVKEGLFLSAFQRSLYNVNGLTGKPWWEPLKMTYAPYFKILEKNWIAIRDEVLNLINKKSVQFAPESEGLQDKGDWKQFELFVKGQKVKNNCDQAAFTCSLIDQMPDASRCKRGQVKFSIMKPGTHVWAHNGPTNCRLRAHLGLVTPPGASIRVANETRLWSEGKVLLFDDSFEHEVWHKGNSDRLVLIVDFWHPELTDRQRASLSPI